MKFQAQNLDKICKIILDVHLLLHTNIPGGLSLCVYEKLLCISSSLPPRPLSLVPVSPEVSLWLSSSLLGGRWYCKPA